VLSRIAESLYWMGRYIERADATARLLDVHVHQLGDRTDAGTGTMLLAAMGLRGDADDVDLWSATQLLAFDLQDPSSVAGSLQLARSNAAGLREVLPAEVWEAINRTHHELADEIEAARMFGPHRFFGWVRGRVALLGGLIDTLVLHDDGWRFLTVGRSLERVDMTSRLLTAVLGSPLDTRWSSVLVSCGANDAFLRLFGGDITVERVLALLLQSEDFPRSTAFALGVAESCLGELARSTATSPMIVRTIGRTRAELAYAPPDALLALADDLMGSIRACCRDADAEITARFFRRVDLVHWSTELVR
jgi:uncharacterized alpha-E superfamily protein